MDYKLLDLYSDYMIASFGQTTATGLERLLNGVVSHDRITRFLAKEDYTSRDLWQLVKPKVRQVESGEDGLVKSLNQNTAPGQSPTRTVRMQSNHFFAAIYSFFKLECLALNEGINQFSFRARFYLPALKASTSSR